MGDNTRSVLEKAGYHQLIETEERTLKSVCEACQTFLEGKVKMSKAIIVVSFGTTYPETRKKPFKPVKRRSNGGSQIFRSTVPSLQMLSLSALKKMKESQFPTVNQLLEQLKKDGVKEVYIQPLHIILGSEYEKVVHQANQFKEDFELLKSGNLFFLVKKIMKMLQIFL